MARPSDGRFLIVWGGLVAGWALRDVLSTGAWSGAMLAFYFGPLEVATLIALTPAERREWTWPRLLAYVLWVAASSPRWGWYCLPRSSTT